MYNFSAADLKDRIDLRDVVNQLWGQPKRQRLRYDVYASRWRDDGRTASFTVYRTYFKDYGGDGISGDLFTFLQHERNIDFAEAMQWAADYVGGGVGDIEVRPAVTSPNNEPPPADWQAAALEALTTTQAYLWGGTADANRALNYLREVRGLTDATIKAAGYGYNPRWSTVNWRHPETRRTVQLAPGIIEPWWCDGVLWALRVRCRVGNLAQALKVRDDKLHGDASPKYLNLTGSRQSGALYKADHITPGEAVLIVEGGFDAQLAAQHLKGMTVVTFGSATNNPAPRRLKQLKAAGRVYLMLDTDEAGYKAVERLQLALGDAAHVVPLPVGKDVTEFIVDHKGDLPALLAQADQLAINRSDSGAWWPLGVPDSVRSAILNYFRPTTASFIELINTAVLHKHINPEAFTSADLLRANLDLNFNMTESILRRILAEVEGIFLYEVETLDTTTYTVSTTGKKTLGRPPKYFALMPLKHVKASIVRWATPRITEAVYSPQKPSDEETETPLAPPSPHMFEAAGFSRDEAVEIANHLLKKYTHVYDTPTLQAKLTYELESLHVNLDNTHSTSLPAGWSLANGMDFRAAFLRATNNRNQRRSRREIMKLTGISNGGLDALVRRAGLERRSETGEYESVEVKSPKQIEQQVKRGARQVKGYPRSFHVDFADGRYETVVYNAETCQTVIPQYITDGATVRVVYQVANHFEFASDEPIPAPPPKPQSQRQGQPQTRHTPRKPRTAVYGPVHDPMWVAEQMRLLLKINGRLVVGECDNCIDPRTGEVIWREDVQRLVALACEGGG
jgi:5S rRNA maturation endonuclease (ribonuclease M5)